jgi:hypothetical protein
MKKIEFTLEFLRNLKPTKEEALSAGDKYFYDGVICKNGHDSPKIVKDNGRCFFCKREETKNNAEKNRRKRGITPQNKVLPLNKGERFGYLTATGNFKVEKSNNRLKNRNLNYHEVKCECGKVFWIVSYNWKVSEQCPECWLKLMSKNNITHSNSQNIIGQLFYSAKQRAKKSKVDFDIEIGDIIIPEYCPILKIKLDVRQGFSDNRKPRFNAPSIDRINSALGYIKGNIIIMSYKANVLKKDGTSTEHIKVAEFMEKMGIIK